MPFVRKLQITCFGIEVALIAVNRQRFRPNDATSYWLNDRREQFMITSSAEISFLLALAVTLIVLATRLVKHPIGVFFKSRTADMLINNAISERLFAAKTIPLQKNCPHCAEATPISALICDACDYNFLSGTVGTKQKSLPAPHLVTLQF